jgi:lipoyl(octanoyl) transferase
MNYSRDKWRIVHTPPASGIWNMAVDEAILEAVVSGESLPTLRLYAWKPACLSLGYAQPYSDIDRERIKSRGWEIVRRPTGGRAILHTDELTYSVIGHQTEPRLEGSVPESYQRLSEALLCALLRLNAKAEIKNGAIPIAGGPQGPVCFEIPSNYEIVFGGKKLIGSAQARKKEGVLQHGSLPLDGDLGRITQALIFANEADREQAAERVRERAITASQAAGRTISWEEAARAFREAFSHVLNLDFVEEGLSEKEKSRANDLTRDKYGNPIWTEKS